MKTSAFVFPRAAFQLLLGGACLLLAPFSQGSVIFQGASDAHVAFEAECFAALQPGLTNAFTNITVVGNSGGGAITTVGSSHTPGAPDGFGTYQIKFRTAGTYYLHYKWKADAALVVGGDPNTANSFRVPDAFGASPAAFNASASNGRTLTGGSITNDIANESLAYTVTPAQVDAGVPLIFKIGTRELGMIIDRFVFDANPTLSLDAFDALLNSQTDTVVQNAGATFVAFEAEGAGVAFQPGLTNAFTNITVAGNSGGGAIITVGSNHTPGAPDGFASYQIKFRTAGTYYLHYKWKADAALVVGGDPNTANSFRVPDAFGASPAVFNVSASNGRTLTGGSITNDVANEALAHTVTTEQVDTGAPLIFKIGTRELGMIIDRFVFDANPTLSLDAFDALPNSGQQVAGPKIVGTVGSASLTNVTLLFSKALDFFSVEPSAFAMSGGATVLAATVVDFATTSRRVLLTTSPQTPGASYTLTVNGLAANDQTDIATNTQTRFTAWRLSVGWVLREYFFDVPGSAVADLDIIPEYPDSPSSTSWAKSFSLTNDPLQGSYGVRLSALYTPPVSGIYEFLINSDDEAQLSLAESNGAPLQLLVTSPCCSTAFSDSLVGTTPFPLVAGRGYLLVAVLKQNAGDVRIEVGARMQNSGIPAGAVPVLAGGQIAAYANPDLAAVSITRQPASTNATVGHRATFRIAAVPDRSGEVLCFQWQRNGANLPGATRRSYTPPPVTLGHHGDQYRCIVGINGNNVPSAPAILSVVPGAPPARQPYIGVNFTGGAAGILNAGPGDLLPGDTAGAIPQERFNNIAGASAAGTALVDATDAATPVTLTVTTSGTYYTGTGINNDGNDLLFQGYLANANASYDVALNGVPAGDYSLLVYSLGFFFDSTYEQGIGLDGAAAYPTFHYTAQSSREYVNAGRDLLRASSADANARAKGNYVQFDNVRPAPDGSFTIHVLAESPVPGTINQLPVLSGFQLVRVVSSGPVLTIRREANGSVTIGWDSAAVAYTLESTGQLGPGANWKPVAGVANPITAAGSVTASPSGAQFYRLKK